MRGFSPPVTWDEVPVELLTQLLIHVACLWYQICYMRAKRYRLTVVRTGACPTREFSLALQCHVMRLLLHYTITSCLLNSINCRDCFHIRRAVVWLQWCSVHSIVTSLSGFACIVNQLFTKHKPQILTIYSIVLHQLPTCVRTISFSSIVLYNLRWNMIQPQGTWLPNNNSTA